MKRLERFLKECRKLVRREIDAINEWYPKLRILSSLVPYSIEAYILLVERNTETKFLYQKRNSIEELHEREKKKIIKEWIVIHELLEDLDLNFRIGRGPFVRGNCVITYSPFRKKARINLEISGEEFKKNYDEEGMKHINKLHASLLKLFDYDLRGLRRDTLNDNSLRGMVRILEENEIKVPKPEELKELRDKLLKILVEYSSVVDANKKPGIVCRTFGEIFRATLNESNLEVLSFSCGTYSKVSNSLLICHDSTLVINNSLKISLYDSISSRPYKGRPVPLNKLHLYKDCAGLGIAIER